MIIFDKIGYNSYSIFPTQRIRNEQCSCDRCRLLIMPFDVLWLMKALPLVIAETEPCEE
jgi:hypothetical protein